MSNIAKKLAQDRKNILRREDYRKVKKMDRSQFEGFCKTLYMEGYNDGRNSVPALISLRSEMRLRKRRESGTAG